MHLKLSSNVKTALLILGALMTFLLINGVIFACGVLIVAVWDQQELTTAEVFEYFGAPIPRQAQNVVLEDGGFGSSYVAASFQAAPQDAQPFIEGICDGALVQGYDPFIAQDTAEPLAGSILIKMEDFVYYSLSTEAPDTIWGLRCHALTNGVHQLRVDKSDSEMWRIRFEQPGGDCLRPLSPVPQCSDMGVEYSNPIDDVPLMVIGLHEIGDEWVLQHPELCFEFLRYPLSVIGRQDEWQRYIGSIMEISIDNVALPTGIVHHRQRLLIAEEFIIDTDIHGQNDIYWDVCAEREWVAGKHEVMIRVSPVSGAQEVWSFTFVVEDEST
jgi:hypothetical protein